MRRVGFLGCLTWVLWLALEDLALMGTLHVNFSGNNFLIFSFFPSDLSITSKRLKLDQLIHKVIFISLREKDPSLCSIYLFSPFLNTICDHKMLRKHFCATRICYIGRCHLLVVLYFLPLFKNWILNQ